MNEPKVYIDCRACKQKCKQAGKVHQGIVIDNDAKRQSSVIQFDNQAVCIVKNDVISEIKSIFQEISKDYEL